MVIVPSAKGVSGIAVTALFVGGILAWSGIKGFSVSTTLKDFLSGKNPNNQTPTMGVSAGGLFGGLGGLLTGNTLLSTNTVTSTGGSVSGNEAQNKALGQRMAAAYGWGSGAQWTALNNIVMAESGWSATIKNPTSTASGIAQNIQGFGPGYQYGNAPQQIAWMLKYIKTKYGNPVNAWNYHLANNSY